MNGYVVGRNIISNARPHVGQRFVLNIDLEDFFGSINYGRVYGLLLKPPYSFKKPVAAAIAKACTLDNKLPQGAPSSPVISNLICSKLDTELSRLAKAHGCVYTRYADDLTFSSSGSMSLATRMRQPDGTSVCHISPTLTTIVESNGFRINSAKVRLSQRQHRQEVTGLIVNKRINVKRRFIREVRAMLHAWQKFGLAAAQSDFTKIHDGSTANFETVVRGKIGFIGYVRGRPDILFRNFATQFNSLTTGPKIRTELTKEEIAQHAVWVIEHEDGQGTAFFAEGYGLVTCVHCVGPKLYIYNPENHTKRFPVTVIAQDAHKDLAILTIPPELSGIVPIPISKGKIPTKGAAVQLLGYPAHHAARPIRVESGSVIRTFPKSAVAYLEITPKIIGGNSGGPVINDKFEAVGVAVLGLNGKIDLKSTEFLAVSANELKGLPKVKAKR